MRLFNVLGILFYATVLIIIGLILISVAVVFSLKNSPIQPQDVNYLIEYLQSSFYARMIIFLSGLLLILVSFSFAQLILGRFQREKTIAFTSSSGQVTVSLSAIEDLIRRLNHVIPEIKELRPDVKATKKGIEIDLRVILKSEANIPELTAHLQEITQSKIQEVLGVEEQIITRIHIIKIISHEERHRRKKESDKEEPTIPFGGYGRV